MLSVHATRCRAGNTVIAGLPRAVSAALQAASLPARFDALLGLTVALKSFDHWMNDNECYEPGGACEKAVAHLAAAWKALLRHGDDALGIDAEFTRPGVEALLGALAAQLAQVERGDADGYAFPWK